ncbi:MAG: 4-vinyl reductase [Polyangiaceae bacterium]|nr:4-vinyl reductase [Polyangiaceae bacterium]MCW5789516.1 4-vinyl reductase [Polyangiaceae bacterium]
MSVTATSVACRTQISTLRVRESYIRERFGVSEYQRWLSQAGEPLRSALLAPDPADGWVPLDRLIELCELAEREFGTGGDQLILAMGRYSAHHTGGVWRSMFERGVGVHQFMAIAAGIWHRHYDCGRVVTGEANGDTAEVTILGMPRPSRAHCLSVRGWLEGVFSFNPSSHVIIHEVSCRASGDEACRMTLTWQPVTNTA